MTARPADGHTQTLTVGGSGSASSSERAWILRVVEGPNRGQSVKLEGGSVVVGAGGDADLVLNDGGVSRRHLELAVVAGGVRVVDLSSKNGTRLLGAKLSVAVVGVGAEIVLGQTTLRVDDADADADAVTAFTFGAMTTKATQMARAFGALARAAPTEVPILLEGEAGTGKGALARAIHLQSPRAHKPFVEVDVASASPSTLFGQGEKPGAFEKSNGGTLFLDDIAALSPEVQPIIARAVASGVVVRPGDRPRRLSFRMLAATTRDIDGLVKAGRVRAELRDVLAVVKVRVPALRDRIADLPDLARAMLRELGRPDADAGAVAALDPDALLRLAGHRFAGNLRELKTLLARAVASAPSPTSPLVVSVDAPAQAATLRDQRESAERDTLQALLDRNGGNVSAAARDAGVDRRHMHRLLKKHGLRGG